MAVEEEREPGVEKPDAVEHQRVLLCVLVELLHELVGEVRPVNLRVDVVEGVEPVVERSLVIGVVQHGVRQAVVAARVVGLDERVLGPVPKHHREGDHDEGRDARPDRRHGINGTSVQVHCDGAVHPGGAPREEIPALALERA